MARLPLIDPVNVAGPLGDVLRSRPPLNIYRILPNAPAAAEGFLALGRAILSKSALDPKLRELAILRVGALSNAHYEVHQHRKVARNVGVTDEKIEAALLDTIGKGFSETERAVLEFTDAVVREVKAPDELYARMAEHIAPQEQLELVMAIGFYMLVSRVLENFEVDLEEHNVEITEMPHD